MRAVAVVTRVECVSQSRLDVCSCGCIMRMFVVRHRACDTCEHLHGLSMGGRIDAIHMCSDMMQQCITLRNCATVVEEASDVGIELQHMTTCECSYAHCITSHHITSHHIASHRITSAMDPGRMSPYLSWCLQRRETCDRHTFDL